MKRPHIEVYLSEAQRLLDLSASIESRFKRFFATIDLEPKLARLVEVCEYVLYLETKGQEERDE